MNVPDLDRRLDDELRAAFWPPPAERFEAIARAAAKPPVRRWPWLVAAAAVLVAVALAVTRPVRGPEGHNGRELGAMWLAAYEHALAEGFDACCSAGVDLRAECRKRFAEEIDVASGGDVQLLGCYCGLSTGGCMAVLARLDGEPVCVYLVPRTQDPRPRLPEGSRVDFARRVLGDVVLYAMSEADAAKTLADFVQP
jgi:hypothetical protein